VFTCDSNSPAVSDLLLRLFTDGVMDHALYTLDESGRVTTWNRGAQRLFGYAAEEILGRSFERFYPPESVSRDEPARELAVARERGNYENESWRVRKDGSQIGTYVVITPLRDSQQSLRGYAVITRDVTQHQRSVQELQDQKRRLRSILDTAVDAVVIIDERGVVESFNPAGERMFGYKADEVIGQNVSMLMPQPFAREHTSYIQRYLRTGKAKIIGIGREVQGRRKDGSVFPADLAVSEFYDGKALFTGIIRDISERKALEAEVLQIAEAEQRRIGQELHDDAQQQLSGLVMIARHAADSLAAHVSQVPELSDVHAKLERVVKGLRDANQSLRQVARGLVPLQVEAQGLHSALANLASQIQELHSVNCRCSVDEEIVIHDNGTAAHLYRIAQEAVNNSLKHGSARQIDIRFRIDDGAPVLEIVDDGVGISEVPKNRGRGLQIMSYRAGLIGAVLTVRQGEAGGTIVRCDFPRTTSS
jgi:two-component system sensor kinase FixL